MVWVYACVGVCVVGRVAQGGAELWPSCLRVNHVHLMWIRNAMPTRKRSYPLSRLHNAGLASPRAEADAVAAILEARAPLAAAGESGDAL